MVEPPVEPIVTPTQLFARLQKMLRFCVAYGGTSVPLGKRTKILKSSGKIDRGCVALLVEHETDYYVMMLTEKIPASIQLAGYTPPSEMAPAEYRVCGVAHDADSFEQFARYIDLALDHASTQRRSDVRSLFVPGEAADAL